MNSAVFCPAQVHSEEDAMVEVMQDLAAIGGSTMDEAVLDAEPRNS